jgi:hypothetical protein
VNSRLVLRSSEEVMVKMGQTWRPGDSAGCVILGSLVKFLSYMLAILLAQKAGSVASCQAG